MIKVLSLGAGVQSSTIFIMACLDEIEKPDYVLFSDTGWESLAVYEWLKYLESWGKQYNLPIIKVSKGNIKRDAIEVMMPAEKPEGRSYGRMPMFVKSGGLLRRQCTQVYKIGPLEKKQRELAGYKPRQRIPAGTVEVWKGISTDEMRRATISPVKWTAFYYPLIELGMSRHDCLQWFIGKGSPLPPRSSCLGCPFKKNKEWRKLKKHSPAEWNEVVEFDKMIRHCIGSELYLHRDRVPLDEVDLSIAEDHGQLNLFDSECMGMCGV